MEVILKSDGSIFINDLAIPNAQLLSLGNFKVGKPVRVIISFDADTLVAAHSVQLDKSIQNLTLCEAASELRSEEVAR